MASVLALTASVPAAPPGTVTTRPSMTFVVLQMNLCGSGMERSCYSFGRAVDEAVANIRRYPPGLVAVQEVCRDDLYAPAGWGKLPRAMAGLYGSAHVSVDFTPALDPSTGRPYRCLNGQQYGVAVIHHGDGRDIHRGWYRTQDPNDEVRAWTCVTVVEGRLTGCTTHLSTSPGVAMRQCHELMSILTSRWVMPEVVVSGDLNLAAGPGARHDVRDCVPAGYDRRSDNAVQQVFFTRNVQWIRGGYEAMSWTDHPLLYETLRV